MVDQDSTPDGTAGPVDEPLAPDEMLALIDDETRGVRRALTGQVPVHYIVWGAAWLIGYTVLWASWDGSGSPVAIPPAVAVPGFVALLVGAAVTSAVVGIRSNRGIRGPSDFVGTVYGISWMILGVTIALIGSALDLAGMSSELAALYYTSAYALLVATMYLAGAMIWHSIDQLVIAIVMAFAAAATPFFGAPANLLAMALIAGIALIAGGVVALVRYRRL